MPVKDLTGQRFGKLVVISQNPEERLRQGRRDIFWNCKCDCGNMTIRMGWQLKRVKDPSCGKCSLNETIGKRFGMLTVLEYSHNEKRNDKSQGGRNYFKCQCDCGNIITVEYSHLTSGHTQSCGCSKSSLGEQLIQNILEENHISFIREYSFPDLKDKKPLRFDFAIINNNNNVQCLIEFDGLQHIEGCSFGLDSNFNQELLLKHDKMKEEYAKQHNIPLIRIPYKDKRKNKIGGYLKDYIKRSE